MRKNQQLVIVLPEGSEELPIRIVRGSRSMELRLCLCPPDGEERYTPCIYNRLLLNIL